MTEADAGWVAAADEELRQLADEVLYTEKTHMAAAERLSRYHSTLGGTATVASAAAAATVVADWSPVLSGLLALLAALASGLLTFLKPDKSAQQHLDAGRQLAALRVQLRQTLALELTVLPQPAIRTRIAELSQRKQDVDGTAPATTGRDYNTASEKIKSGMFDRDR